MEVVASEDTIQVAARLVDELDVGALPVCEGRRLMGMITDRDFSVRATAAGRAPDSCAVEEVMTAEVECCLDDEDIEHAVERMRARQIRRLPVVERGNNREVGILALGDIATGGPREIAGEAVHDISRFASPDR
ncbi:MAG: CBS domain-containing protein [Rhodospirillaceae bacterium]|nr:CBS domain-containing protein [Rhodospirillaceae bacterium]